MIIAMIAIIMMMKDDNDYDDDECYYDGGDCQGMLLASIPCLVLFST